LKKLFTFILATILLVSCSHEATEKPKNKLTAVNLEATPFTTTKSGVLPVHEPKKLIPEMISIPNLHVEAPIKAVGLDDEGRMATIPSADTIAWYEYGSTPGQVGNSILAGHRDWKGKLGSFRNIEKLNKGDEVSIRFNDGSVKSFIVISNETYSLKDVPEVVMDLGGEERTTLITCAGRFIKEAGGYQNRVVVVLKSLVGEAP
jgi:LPXTG-site transpeptidase (sortase) family protein